MTADVKPAPAPDSDGGKAPRANEATEAEPETKSDAAGAARKPSVRKPLPKKE